MLTPPKKAGVTSKEYSKRLKRWKERVLKQEKFRMRQAAARAAGFKSISRWVRAGRPVVKDVPR